MLATGAPKRTPPLSARGELMAAQPRVEFDPGPHRLSSRDPGNCPVSVGSVEPAPDAAGARRRAGPFRLPLSPRSSRPPADDRELSQHDAPRAVLGRADCGDDRRAGRTRPPGARAPVGRRHGVDGGAGLSGRAQCISRCRGPAAPAARHAGRMAGSRRVRASAEGDLRDPVLPPPARHDHAAGAAPLRPAGRRRAEFLDHRGRFRRRIHLQGPAARPRCRD